MKYANPGKTLTYGQSFKMPPREWERDMQKKEVSVDILMLTIDTVGIERTTSVSTYGRSAVFSHIEYNSLPTYSRVDEM